MSLFTAKSAAGALPNPDCVYNPMLAATTSINGRLGAGNTDAVALFAQLMPTLAGNIETANEFVYDRFPTLPGWTFAVTVFLFHCREKFQTRLFVVLCSAALAIAISRNFLWMDGAISHLLLRELRGEVLKKLQKGPDHLCIQFCAGLF